MKLVILDRDGVINYNLNSGIVTPSQWQAIPGSLQAIAKLKQAGYVVVVATNQSIIAKKMATIEDLDAIHKKMHACLKEHGAQIDHVFYCPHQSEDNCMCRKPQPGMLLHISKKYQIDFSKIPTPFVGDTITDLQAAVAAKAVPVLVKTGRGIKTMLLARELSTIKGFKVFNNLSAFVDEWLQSGGGARCC